MAGVSGMRRREVLQLGLAATAVAVAGGLPRVAWAGAAPSGPDAFHGLKVGVASYTFRKFTLDQCIDMTEQAGVRYLTLKDMHLPMKSTRAEREAAHRKVTDAGLVLMGGGVIYLANKEDAIRAAFDYCRDAGMPTMVCSPDPAALDAVESLAKEYDIRIAIHNHGPGDKRYPSPLDVLKMVKDRDPRMGICMDVGHAVRLGEEPVAVIRQCGARLLDFHMKDVTNASAKGACTVAGKGIIQLDAVLKALVDMKFPHHVALEYEADGDDPLPGVIASFDYMRKVCAAIA
ncbi:MAG: sugar phosphate isomerase/epimerase [Planctomycetes bacterium]|nr:sugar phosphate isomerase/epimerase [Planctomycetota bacterium]